MTPSRPRRARPPRTTPRLPLVLALVALSFTTVASARAQPRNSPQGSRTWNPSPPPPAPTYRPPPVYGTPPVYGATPVRPERPDHGIHPPRFTLGVVFGFGYENNEVVNSGTFGEFETDPLRVDGMPLEATIESCQSFDVDCGDRGFGLSGGIAMQIGIAPRLASALSIQVVRSPRRIHGDLFATDSVVTISSAASASHFPALRIDSTIRYFGKKWPAFIGGGLMVEQVFQRLVFDDMQCFPATCTIRGSRIVRRGGTIGALTLEFGVPLRRQGDLLLLSTFRAGDRFVVLNVGLVVPIMRPIGVQTPDRR